MRLENHDLYRLLVDVNSVFVASLPTITKYEPSPKKSLVILARNNAITQLRNEVNRMQLDFTTGGLSGCELSGDLLRETESAIHSLLCDYENHVKDAVEYHDDFNFDSSFPKLELVRQYSAEAQDWIVFNDSHSKNKHTRNLVHKVNELLDQARCHVRQDTGIEVPFFDEVDTRADAAELAEALRLSDACRKILEVLEKHHKCVGGNQRDGFLRLPRLDQTTLDMLLSVCCSPDPCTWQQAYFYLYKPPEEKAVPLRSTMCRELRSSLQKGVATRVVLSQSASDVPIVAAVDIADGMRLHNLSGKRDIIEFQPPTRTLRSILDEENGDKWKHLTPKRRILQHNIKKGLGVEIAAAVFFLFTCPLFQTYAWNTESIHIFQASGGGGGSGGATAVKNAPLPPAYLSFCLDVPLSGDDCGQDPDQQSPSTSFVDQGNPLLLALTAILLELELEQPVTLCEKDRDDLTDELSLHMALDRYHRVLAGSLDPALHSVIQSCLDLYDKSSLGGDNCDDTVSQENLFNEVVSPLMHRYKILRNETHTEILKPVAATVPIKKNNPLKDISGSLNDMTTLIDQLHKKLGNPIVQLGSIAEGGGCEGNDSREVRTERISSTQNSVHLPSVSCDIPLAIPRFQQTSIRNGAHWLNNIDDINDIMDLANDAYQTGSTRQKRERVRIAILDTGCDPDNQAIIHLGVNEFRLNQNWKDFAGTSDHPVDESSDLHGTKTAALLLRVARHADIYVARIATGNSAGGQNKGDREAAAATIPNNIANAIRHATKAWDVDIISMSVGFQRIDSTVAKAISTAVHEREHAGRGILFFAAANNEGGNQNEMYPASDVNVLSVRGTDHVGAFVPAYNPPTWPDKKNHWRFGTLGKNVPFDCGQPEGQPEAEARLVSGCSFATPIFAGMVAIIIQYVDHQTRRNNESKNKNNINGNGNGNGHAVEGREDIHLQKGVRELRGIVQVLERLTTYNADRQRSFTLWPFFEKDDLGRMSLIRDALGSLQMRF